MSVVCALFRSGPLPCLGSKLTQAARLHNRETLSVPSEKSQEQKTCATIDFISHVECPVPPTAVWFLGRCARSTLWAGCRQGYLHKLKPIGRDLVVKPATTLGCNLSSWPTRAVSLSRKGEVIKAHRACSARFPAATTVLHHVFSNC